MLPKLISGNVHNDQRGSLKYNNNFDATAIKRMYLIENENTQIKRGWQGHKIEQRWFTAVSGTFKISLLEIDNWENPLKNLQPIVFEIASETLNILHIPAGFVTCIQALQANAKLLVMANYNLGEINDEYKFELHHFDCSKI